MRWFQRLVLGSDGLRDRYGEEIGWFQRLASRRGVMVSEIGIERDGLVSEIGI